MTPGPSSARLSDLCVEVGFRLDGPTRERVFHIRGRLRQPLWVGVGGASKAGTSTLDHALIGRRVIPTDGGEGARAGARFQHGAADRVDVVRHDGGRVALALDGDGMVPPRLGVPPDEVAYLDVTLTSERLRDLTVVDPPGGAGGPSPLALAGAEAVVYVFAEPVGPEAMHAVAHWVSTGPANSLGVLTRVDALAGSGLDPWPLAQPLAAEQSRALRALVAEVVPVVGLLAETIETGRLTATDVDALRALAALPDGERRVLLATPDLFRNRDCTVPRGTRERLLDLLHLYGVSFAVHMLGNRLALTAADLVRLLGQASGFPRLRHTIDQVFLHRADDLKVRWALTALERAADRSGRPGDRDLLRAAIEEFRGSRG